MDGSDINSSDTLSVPALVAILTTRTYVQQLRPLPVGGTPCAPSAGKSVVGALIEALTQCEVPPADALTPPWELTVPAWPAALMPAPGGIASRMADAPAPLLVPFPINVLPQDPPPPSDLHARLHALLLYSGVLRYCPDADFALSESLSPTGTCPFDPFALGLAALPMAQAFDVILVFPAPTPAPDATAATAFVSASQSPPTFLLAHRAILAARSPYFAALFACDAAIAAGALVDPAGSCKCAGSGGGRVEVPIGDCTAPLFAVVLRAIYGEDAVQLLTETNVQVRSQGGRSVELAEGRAPSSVHRYTCRRDQNSLSFLRPLLQDVLRLADLYQLADLRAACLLFIARRIVPANSAGALLLGGALADPMTIVCTTYDANTRYTHGHASQ